MFSTQNLQINRGITTCSAQGTLTAINHTYKDKNETAANIITSFPDYLGLGANQDVIIVGDILLINASDKVQISEILTLAPFTIGPDLFSGASTPLSVGSPIVAVDANAVKITGTTLQMEIADETYPGIVTTGSQSFEGTKTFGAGVLTNIIDGATGAEINIGATIASGIRFEQNTTVTSGKYLRTDILDCTTPAQLVLGPTVATTIILSQNTMVGAGKILRADFMEASAFGAISIGAANTTAVNIAVDTTVTAGHKLLTNEIDAVSATSMQLGSTNATEIMVGSNVHIDASKFFTANSLDTTTGAPLVVGLTNATGVSVTPLITSLNGIAFSPSGGTPKTLNYYQADSFGTTFTCGANTGPTINMQLTRLGNVITVLFQNGFGGVSGGASRWQSNAPLPSAYVPPTVINGFWRALDDTYFAGMIVIDAGGTMYIYKHADQNEVFTSFNCGFDVGTITFTI